MYTHVWIVHVFLKHAQFLFLKKNNVDFASSLFWCYRGRLKTVQKSFRITRFCVAAMTLETPLPDIVSKTRLLLYYVSACCQDPLVVRPTSKHLGLETAISQSADSFALFSKVSRNNVCC